MVFIVMVYQEIIKVGNVSKKEIRFGGEVLGILVGYKTE